MTEPSNVSHAHRVAWGSKGGSVTAARRTPVQRRLSAKNATAARNAKYSHEELSKKYAGCFTRILSRFTPEQAVEIRKGAGQKRWQGMSAEEISRAQTKAIQTRWDKVAYAKNPEPADRLFAFLQDFIASNRYCPTVYQIGKLLHHNPADTGRLLRILEAIGRINRHATGNRVVITLNEPTPSDPIMPALGSDVLQISLAPIVTPRKGKKCYDCDAPAVTGKARCEKHLEKVSKSSLLAHRRRKAHPMSS